MSNVLILAEVSPPIQDDEVQRLGGYVLRSIAVDSAEPVELETQAIVSAEGREVITFGFPEDAAKALAPYLDLHDRYDVVRERGAAIANCLLASFGMTGLVPQAQLNMNLLTPYLRFAAGEARELSSEERQALAPGTIFTITTGDPFDPTDESMEHLHAGVATSPGMHMSRQRGVFYVGPIESAIDYTIARSGCDPSTVRVFAVAQRPSAIDSDDWTRNKAAVIGRIIAPDRDRTEAVLRELAAQQQSAQK